MNRRIVTIFALASVVTCALQAQEKDPANKGEKAGEKSKVLIFQPGEKLPNGVTEPGVAKGDVVQRAIHSNPMLDGPAQIVSTFFASLKEGKIDEGYATLTKGSKIAEKPEELRQLKAKTREAIEVFGNINGFDFVESKAIGQRLVRATYVSLGKVFPLRWRFYFYKPEEVWRLIDMRVDDKLPGIFDEAEEPKPADAAPPP
jgi:hypothetical protein